MPQPQLAVVLLNLGGPDSLEAVPKFMRNLFMDPEIFRFPLGAITQPFFASMITRLRAKKVRAQYEAIGGKSPLAALTQAQAIALQANLRNRGIDAAVGVGMRYWHPFVSEALDTLSQLTKDVPLIALPLFPHYSKATTGSSLRQLNEALHKVNCFSCVHTIEHYYDHPRYIQAFAERIEEGLRECTPDQTHLLFSAHGLPESFVRGGDPYIDQIERSFELLRAKFPDVPAHLAYQSRVGPVKWVGPSVEEKLKELARDGVKSLLVVPLSFVSDHIETLYEIDVTYAQHARALGIESFRRVKSLNDSPAFVDCLAELVIEARRVGLDPPRLHAPK